jgi:hypothetical protein
MQCALAIKDGLSTTGMPSRTYFGDDRTGKRKLCAKCREVFFTNTRSRICMRCKPFVIRRCKKCKARLFEPRIRICLECKKQTKKEPS